MTAATKGNDRRNEAIQEAIAQITKQFGKGAIMKLGEKTQAPGVEVIPSGSISLDLAMGTGGVPRGRVVEIFGPESSGKTTLTLHMVAEAQKAGGVAAFIDVEHALDPIYAQKLGVDIDNLLVSQPGTGEEALEIADSLAKTCAIDIIVIDSVAALVPRAELEGAMGDSHVGLQARLMSQALRKLTSTVARSRTCVVFINQIREKIGVMFGNPETTTGGRALKFYASLRIDIRRIETITKGEQAIGSRVRVKVVKNKLAPPFTQAEFDMYFGQGINREGEIVDLGVKYGLLERSGTWYAYGSTKLGQGREAAVNLLRENRELAKELERKIFERAGIVSRAQTGDTAGRDRNEKTGEKLEKSSEKTASQSGTTRKQ